MLITELIVISNCSKIVLAVIIGVTIAVGAALMAAIGIMKLRNYTRINGKGKSEIIEQWKFYTTCMS